ncbi:hypothetical protein B0H10DRAFT_2187636 [Mycena sp. CBHHK59/15]|nr:hypothetical protein B0H10DRAFT_2187636 [Mycena sp. CBHHK59/15]
MALALALARMSELIWHPAVTYRRRARPEKQRESRAPDAQNDYSRARSPVRRGFPIQSIIQASPRHIPCSTTFDETREPAEAAHSFTFGTGKERELARFGHPGSTAALCPAARRGSKHKCIGRRCALAVPSAPSEVNLGMGIINHSWNMNADGPGVVTRPGKTAAAQIG